MKNALIAAGLVLAGFTMVPSAASAMCIGAGNICVDTQGNSGYQQYQPYGQQNSNRSYQQPQAITFPTHTTTFPSYIPSNQYGSQYQYGYQQYQPYGNYGYQGATYYYPTQQYSNNQYGYNYYEEYYDDYYEEYYGSNYGGSNYGNSAGCGYSQGGAYYCY